MTTTVIIKANCASEREVLVVIKGDYGFKPGQIERFVMQNGEEVTRYIYDDRGISINERGK